MRAFDADDARGIFDQLVPVEASKGGRDFVFTVERVTGGSVLGRVVERTDTHLGLLIEDPPHNRSARVAWDDIVRITINVE